MKFRIPALDDSSRNKIKRLVDRILAAKTQDADANMIALEREIDQLVYALYGLAPEEIQIAEESAE